MKIQTINLAEEIQEYITNNSGLGYNHDPASGDVNFTLGNVLNVVDLDLSVGSNITLTMHEEGGAILPGGRKARQERIFRFICQAETGQAAINLCWSLYEWFWNNARLFQTSTFKVLIPRGPDTLPTVIAAQDNGVYLANFSMTFFAFQRTA